MEKNSSSHNVDKIISKKILHHIQTFFKIKYNDNDNHRSKLNKSKRNRIVHNKTLKKRPN